MKADATDYYLKKTISNKLITIILIIATVIVLHIAFNCIIFFIDFDDNISLIYLEIGSEIISHQNITILYSLIIIQGLLKRDIFEIFFATLVLTITSLIYISGMFTLAFEAVTVLYVINSVSIVLGGIVLIFILCFTYELRSDIEWFYYKSFGPGYNARIAIERTTDTFFKLTIQVFLSMIVQNYYFSDNRIFIIFEMFMYAILLFSNALEHSVKKFNIYLRSLTLISALVLCIFHIMQFVDIDLSEDGFSSIIKHSTRTLAVHQILKLCLQMALLGIYAILLIVHTLCQVNGWGLRVDVDSKERKRFFI
ncbi:hypothetical protein NEAUS06_2361 [Nematocida ausubeli]|nr:hypothetical protein NEAUS06_2361 [Nematocida ausubeli]